MAKRRRVTKINVVKKANQITVLTREQRNLVFAICATDGWIEMGKNNVNPQIGLEQKKDNRSLLNYFCYEMRPFVVAIPMLRYKPSPTTGKLYPMVIVRSIAHSEFHYFRVIFGGSGKQKTIPSVDDCKKHLTWHSFVIMIACDGSVHQLGQSNAMELHLEGSSWDANARMAVALHEKLGIICWPTKSNSVKGTRTAWCIHISGINLPLIRQYALPYFYPELKKFAYKVPPSTGNSQKPHQVRQAQMKQAKFLVAVRNESYMSNINTPIWTALWRP